MVLILSLIGISWCKMTYDIFGWLKPQFAQLERRELKLNNFNFRGIHLVQLKLQWVKSHNCDTWGTKMTIKLITLLCRCFWLIILLRCRIPDSWDVMWNSFFCLIRKKTSAFCVLVIYVDKICCMRLTYAILLVRLLCSVCTALCIF